jgi:hypothetical protein
MSCLFSLGATIINQIWSAFVTSFLWGFTLYFVSANLMVLCSRLYEGKTQSFALTKQFHSLFFFFYEIVALSTDNKLPVRTIMYGLLVLAIVALWAVSHLPLEHEIIPLRD